MTALPKTREEASKWFDRVARKNQLDDIVWCSGALEGFDLAVHMCAEICDPYLGFDHTGDLTASYPRHIKEEILKLLEEGK